MIIRFITGLAWTWGALALSFTIVQLIPPVTKKDAERFGQGLLELVPAVAWLLAVYVLR